MRLVLEGGVPLPFMQKKKLCMGSQHSLCGEAWSWGSGCVLASSLQRRARRE